MRLIARNRNTTPTPVRGQAVQLVESWATSQPQGNLTSFQDFVHNAYQSNGIVYALVAARTRLMSQASFVWENQQSGSRFTNQALALLEQPWPGGTTGDLIRQIETDCLLAGNAYIHRTPEGLQRLRPDWIRVVFNESATWVGGYIYQPPGGRPRALPADDVVQIVDQPDPLAPYRGLSPLTPVARQILTDDDLEQHKRSFLNNAATPNMVVKIEQALSADDRRVLEKAIERRHEGPSNAWRTMLVDRGADVMVVGKDMQEIAFVDLSAETEARICQALGTPPIIVGAQKGLDASTYSNFSQAFRLWIDGTIIPRWDVHADGLHDLFGPAEVPQVSRLAADYRKVPALQEDAKDAAEINDLQARTLGALIRAGYTPESSVSAVVNQDLTLLAHTGLAPVTLQSADDLDGDSMQMDAVDSEPADPLNEA